MCTNHLFLLSVGEDASTPNQVCCLGGRLEEEVDQIKSYRSLKGEVNTLTEQVKKLDGASHQAEKLVDANSILMAEMTSLREIDKFKVDAVKEFKDSQPFVDLLGSQYGEGFEDFRKQAVASSQTWTFPPSRLTS